MTPGNPTRGRVMAAGLAAIVLWSALATLSVTVGAMPPAPLR
jgi:hypothetical protein